MKLLSVKLILSFIIINLCIIASYLSLFFGKTNHCWCTKYCVIFPCSAVKNFPPKRDAKSLGNTATNASGAEVQKNKLNKTCSWNISFCILTISRSGYLKYQQLKLKNFGFTLNHFLVRWYVSKGSCTETIFQMPKCKPCKRH